MGGVGDARDTTLVVRLVEDYGATVAVFAHPHWLSCTGTLINTQETTPLEKYYFTDIWVAKIEKKLNEISAGKSVSESREHFPDSKTIIFN